MNIRLIIGVLGGIIAIEFLGIIYQTKIYKDEVNKSIEYEKFRKQVLDKATKEREEIRKSLEVQEKMKKELEVLKEKQKENLREEK